MTAVKTCYSHHKISREKTVRAVPKLVCNSYRKQLGMHMKNENFIQEIVLPGLRLKKKVGGRK
jgi:hypothetical protein